MFEYFQAIVLILVCGIFDRLRGDNAGFGGVAEAFMMGLCAWPLFFAPYASDYSSWLIYGLLFSAGSYSGWGTVVGSALHYPDRPMGPGYEWWQFGVLKKNTWLAAAFRGGMWGAPGLILLPWHPVVLIPFIAMTLAFPSALWTGSKIGSIRFGSTVITEKSWQTQELIRGSLFGALCFAIFQLIK